MLRIGNEILEIPTGEFPAFYLKDLAYHQWLLNSI